MQNNWLRMVRAVAHRYGKASYCFGVPEDELISVGLFAAQEAEESFDPAEGVKLESWVYSNITWAMQAEIKAEVHYRRSCENSSEPISDSLHTLAFVHQALDLLQAHLTSPEWELLWMHHAMGYSYKEIALRSGLSVGTLKTKMNRTIEKSVTFLRRNSITLSSDTEGRNGTSYDSDPGRG